MEDEYSHRVSDQLLTEPVCWVTLDQYSKSRYSGDFSFQTQFKVYFCFKAEREREKHFASEKTMMYHWNVHLVKDFFKLDGWMDRFLESGNKCRYTAVIDRSISLVRVGKRFE
jgi:hypothetical protein